ncbi:MAG: hypothetical protein CMH30_03615 [Micavibrio sp.]|nr:hypothetical protein [Micavibrio sp.]|tara:strand:- start:2581 stop:4299 length:1719 start_codon:yes stop_codon:yes gene_type:complete
MADKTQKLYEKALEHYHSGQVDSAEKIFKKIVIQNPKHGETLFALGKIAMQKQRFVLADQHFKKLLSYYPNHADSWTNLGLIYYQYSKNIPESISAFKKALELGANPAPIYLYLADIFKNSGDLNDAREMYEKAIETQPTMAQAHLGLANVLISLHALESAKNHFIQALTLTPHNADIVLNLITLAELQNLTIASYISEDLRTKLSGLGQQFLKAHLAQKNGDIEAAISIFKDLAQNDYLGVEIYRCFTLAELYDKTAQYELAFEYMTRANELQSLTQRAQLINATYYPALLSTIDTAVSNAQFIQDVQARTQNKSVTKQPIFIVGFPRSGTTLTGRILSMIKNVHVNDERSVLGQLSQTIQHDYNLNYPQDLPKLSAQQCDDLRQQYWQAHQKASSWVDTPIFIDKFPLNLIHLPLIYTLFPKSKIIFVKRHPLDSILSALMQNFHLNEAMIHLMKPEQAASLYKEVLSIWFKVSEVLPLEIHIITYENIVDNFDDEVKALLSFLGLEWEENIKDFYKKKQDSFQTITPSATQISQKLYSSSKQRWRHYKQQLEPVVPILSPLIKKLGYTD